MANEQPRFKLLMFPWLAHGHISPYLEFSQKLSTTKHFDVYICSTAVNLDSIRATLAKHKFDQESIKLVQLHMPSSPELPPHLHTTKNMPSNLFPALFQAFQQSISGAEEELPAGFIERVGGRGIVVKWAPQTKILAHPSIGAIVSHSGWNSIMESIYFGVPIVGIPMQYEQRFNARLAVEAGAGVEVERDAGGGYYAGEDVAKGIEKVMREETFREEVRSRAKILSEKIRAEEEKEMNEAAEELLRICSKNVRHDIYMLKMFLVMLLSVSWHAK